MYAARLYDTVEESKDDNVDQIIIRMGLGVCEDTSCASLTRVQRRCLSIGIAVLKQPTLLLLDEPTFGEYLRMLAFVTVASLSAQHKNRFCLLIQLWTPLLLPRY
jgi:ABC-type branched-subunit amino acid transport system ATPase component